VMFVSKRAPAIPHAVSKSNSNVNSPWVEYKEVWLVLDNVSSPTTGRAKEIEEDIVAELVKRHTDWINHSG